MAILIFYNISCGESGNPVRSFPYDLRNPSEKFILPSELREISGITFINEKTLACINDEAGLVYFYSLHSKKIKNTFEFGPSGDYEDIAYANSLLYVLKSNGDIFSLDIDHNDTRKIETGLRPTNNTEGLCFDKENNRLLIACKYKAGEGKELLNKKAVYAFDLSAMKLNVKPVLLIDLDDVSHVIRQDQVLKFTERFSDAVAASEGTYTFQPSGIAVHPFTKEYYLISSSGKLLLVLDNNSTILNWVKLPSDIFRQPEGIAFDKSGNLYISNEGRKGKPTLLRFDYIP